MDEAAEAHRVSTAWSASTAQARDRALLGLRVCRPRPRHPQHGRDPVPTASGTKGLTALTVMSLVERGTLALHTTARSLLGADLPLVAADVTVEQLLGHRSGIGDYLDEDTLGDIADYVMPVPVHELATTEQYLPALDGTRRVPGGERFCVQQRRLRGTRAASRTRERRGLPPTCSHSGL